MNSNLTNKVFLNSLRVDDFESFVLDDLIGSGLSEEEIERLLDSRAVEEKVKQGYYIPQAL